MYDSFINNFKLKIDKHSKSKVKKCKLKFPKPWTNKELESSIMC